jgi:hypothetical protein
MGNQKAKSMGSRMDWDSVVHFDAKAYPLSEVSSNPLLLNASFWNVRKAMGVFSLAVLLGGVTDSVDSPGSVLRVEINLRKSILAGFWRLLCSSCMVQGSGMEGIGHEL